MYFDTLSYYYFTLGKKNITKLQSILHNQMKIIIKTNIIIIKIQGSDVSKRYLNKCSDVK
jgi:hypothetical protein